MFDGIRQFRDQLRAGKPVVGIAVTFNDPVVSDALADCVDYLWYDLEHTKFDPAAINAHLMAARGKGVASIVRIADAEPGTIKPLLDAGAEGLVLAQAYDVEAVEALVRNSLYPPEGVRGVGARIASNYGRAGADFCTQANENVFLSVMIETAEALESIERIVQVPRLDSVVIGPYDLSGAIATLGDVEGDVVNEAIDRIITVAHAAGTHVGIGMGETPEFAVEMFSRGVDWVQVGADFGYMINAVNAGVAASRKN
jgi:2-keto-3-deoxy-L-rhamnonate aldolase RhmA